MSDTKLPEGQLAPDAGGDAVATGTALAAASAMVLGLESAAEAAATDGSPAPATQRKAASNGARVARVARSPRRRRPARVVRGRAPVREPAATATAVDTRSELRDWIKENATLLSNASLLISIAALALNILPSSGFVNPYIQALVVGASLLLLAELHHQWPEDLQLHAFRRKTMPENHSWRMTGFAFFLQLATVIFAVWAALTHPLILLPLTAIAIVLAFRRWYFNRHTGWLGRGFGIVSLIAVILISELLALGIYAAIAGEEITIELWADERGIDQIE